MSTATDPRILHLAEGAEPQHGWYEIPDSALPEPDSQGWTRDSVSVDPYADSCGDYCVTASYEGYYSRITPDGRYEILVSTFYGEVRPGDEEDPDAEIFAINRVYSATAESREKADQGLWDEEDYVYEDYGYTAADAAPNGLLRAAMTDERRYISPD